MAASFIGLVLVTLVASGCAQYQVEIPNISLLSPQGIRFQYPADPQITLVAYHYNINKPLPGVGAGDYNVDVNSPTDGYFQHDNIAVDVNLGDIVYYWVYVLHGGGGYQKTDLSWTAANPTQAPPTQPPTCPPCGTGSPSTQGPTQAPTNPPTSGPTQPPGTAPPYPGDPDDGPCSRYPCDSSCDMGIPPCNGVIFEDTFDYFDMDAWEHEITAGGGGNWEFQYYINNRTNSYVRDSVLYLKPTLTEETYGPGFISSGTLNLWGASPANLCTGHAWWGCERVGNPTNYINPIQSARVRTVDSFAFTYGKVEVRAQMPIGDWIWPAIWLLPRNNGYGEWPASGEIDLVESRGNLNLFSGSTNVGVEQAASTMHWGPFFQFNRYYLTSGHKSLNNGNFGDNFHVYAVEWTPTDIKFSIDDEQILSVDPGSGGFYDFGGFATDAPNTHNPWENSPNKMTPFDQDFYIVMNVAVGGTGGYWSDSLTNQPYPKPWSDTSPTAPRDFWNAKNSWYPTWNPTVNNGEGAAMKVDYVRVRAHGSY